MSIDHRRQVVLENSEVELIVLPGGGHIASMRRKPGGVNPLWDPPWETIEPARFDAARHTSYGAGPEGPLLAGIAGHNLCLDFFGPPSQEEAAAGLTVHGEASVADWETAFEPGQLTARAELPLAGMRVERRIRLSESSSGALVEETVENLRGVDRAIGWTQHVTLGPPFLSRGKTVFRLPATRSKVFEGGFAPGRERFPAGTEFDWPHAPLSEGGHEDLQTYTRHASSAAYTAHLLDPGREQAFFTAYSPQRRTLFGYAWRRADFPWIGIWEENHSRTQAPWNGRSLTRGMEFGVSPFPEPRRQMVDRGTLFGENGFRWLPARAALHVRYCLFVAEADRPPETVGWEDGAVSLDGRTRIRVG